MTIIPSYRWYERHAEPEPPVLSIPDRLPRAPWRPQHPIKAFARWERRTKHGGGGVQFIAPERRRW